MEIDYEMKVELRDNAVIVIDSTGMKITNRGAYKGSKRGIIGQGNTNIIFNFKISSSWKKKFLLLS